MRDDLGARSAPETPRCLSRSPELLEDVLIRERVHALPEAVMMVGDEVALAGEVLQRLLFEGRLVAVNVVAHLGLENEEPAINDDALLECLLAKSLDPHFA